MDERARIPVTLPRPNPTTSYWQDPPDPFLANHRTTPYLPPSADIVIIGSGITGASIAWHLLTTSTSTPPPNILMLEARQTCSGATGRNGGHTKAASYRTFPSHAASLGLPAAIQLARFELATIRAVHAFARDHGIACDLAACDTVDIIYDAVQWDEARSAVAAMRAAMPGEVEDGAARYVLYEKEEVKARFRVGEGGCGGVGYFAGSLSAYRFGVGVVGMCVARGMGLQTGTAVTGLERDEGRGRWRVETGRGTVEAGRVVLATNGYTAALVREFQGVVVPLRGQVQVHRPGRGLKEGGSLEGTYSFVYEGGYEYMVPRPEGTEGKGEIVMGGGLAKAPEGGLWEYGTTDDAAVDETVSRYLKETTARYFGSNWGEDDEEGRVKSEWTGIMGFSPDGFPFVGEVPGKKGLWIAASFQGHGMVLAWKSAEALVEMMEGRDGEKLEAWFPSVFRVNEERMAKRFEGRLQ
ncbi:FAD dependent oxidoreductase [Schizothecium vesticola]|uniref:FAD dependent oxidoreductase n=1 Tax=Schizothecium vesticola TaxID=314040 RepID=A0AA40KAF6_9PEZI|nr:FAD dependent oxidoreductase [Schizothecium vesticola]